MNQRPSFGTIIREPVAFVPLCLSLVAMAFVLGHLAGMLGDFATYGVVVREVDEGTDARIWQLLMAAQMPVLMFFGIKWLPRAPRQTLKVLALQAGAVLANLAVVFFSGLG